MSNLNFTVNLTEAVKKADLVIEAIVEKMPVKHELFSKIDPVSMYFIYLGSTCVFL